MDLFICGVCDERFHLIDKFMLHKQALPVFKCTDCVALFHCKDKLEEHIEITHQVVNSQISYTNPPRSTPSLTQNQENIGQSRRTCDVLQNAYVLKRRPGRPRKTPVSSDDVSDHADVSSQTVESAVYEADTAGLFHCKQCNKAFKKERHVKSHRCLDEIPVQNQYVAELNLSNEEDEDRSADFRAHMPRKRRKIYHLKSTLLDTNLFSKNLEAANNTGNLGPRNLPVFNTEYERLAFEEQLNSINLDCVHNMYISHEVPQEVRQTNSPSKTSKTNVPKSLTIFSCNTCKKVFKTESHMRLHCLSHTELKPFSCQQCEFSTKTKGNLYTHMRWHTGNLYNCDECPFQTGNRNHLQEHKATHSTLNSKCKLCRSSYKTLKSLRNHVLRYHVGLAAKKYLASFKSKNQESLATLHLCHICNKKFKKKIDRDHHQTTAHKVSNNGSLINEKFSGEEISSKKGTPQLVFLCCVCKSVHLTHELLRNHLEEHLIGKNIMQINNEISGKISKDTNEFEEEPIQNDLQLCGQLEVESAQDPVNINPVNAIIGHDSGVTNNLAELSASSCVSKSVKSDKNLSNFPNEDLQESSSCMNYDNSFVAKNVNSEIRLSADYPKDAIQTAIMTANLEALFEESISTKWYLSESQSLRVENHSENDNSNKNLVGNDEDGEDASDHLEMNMKLLPIGQKRAYKERLGQKCPYCDRLFKRSSKDLQRHLHIHQKKQGFRPIACKPAVASVSTTTFLERSYLCDQCGITFSSEEQSILHSKLHTTSHQSNAATISNVQIPECSEEELRISSVDIPEAVNDNHMANEDEQIYNCLSCNCAYTNFTGMLSHLKEQHGIIIDAADLGVQVNNAYEQLQESQLINPDQEPQEDVQEELERNHPE